MTSSLTHDWYVEKCGAGCVTNWLFPPGKKGRDLVLENFVTETKSSVAFLWLYFFGIFVPVICDDDHSDETSLVRSNKHKDNGSANFPSSVKNKATFSPPLSPTPAPAPAP
ncbi:hypothetical protein PHYBLDRAFT_143040 [Phycomyces blakesleeanus NRRL 1555(-)]|uniref:Uncharacterized protein n=1 Tax=Phycomyces blakesleeanus (strain ATCC 8743b / DSM 1359 / FGSC 10004 / NBRC 33097 / NRRL 1555) TaxID=763407 RepID=A0A162XPV6_PHYB8|nr:hypothetical protein PHYBLDRAFT_143040 [Phycomyces blakesleeanus NRRL 1555(-)]OAD76055.1 hypothetical protein PHYBLDRAFT_143040 [Phycomyces blakesleeanus NRRL 1555(-)]|eukprot:XP_018294095.1 hypothetical protein PHYBLDRAFT_143040 [Phycomyces blakesleeanus NRRL 1555(-)]